MKIGSSNGLVHLQLQTMSIIVAKSYIVDVGIRGGGGIKQIFSLSKIMVDVLVEAMPSKTRLSPFFLLDTLEDALFCEFR